jgi:hypothetical protein
MCEKTRSKTQDAPSVGAMFDFADPEGIQLEFLFFDIELRPASP